MRKLSILLSAIVLLFACSTPSETELIILSMNDIHANIDNLDKVAAYVQKQRQQHPNLLLLSAGDLFSGNPVVDYYPERGAPIIDLMNYLQFDVSTIGNHEFDYGQSTLRKRIEQAKFPFVCTNITLDSFPDFPLQDKWLLEKGGIKIVITGILQEKIAAHPKHLHGVEVIPPSIALSPYSEEPANLHISITHQGEQYDSILAMNQPYIDLIVGGHTHTLLDTGMRVNGVLITQAGKYAQYINKTRLRFNHGLLTSKTTETIDVATLTARDTVMSRKIANFNANPTLNKVVGSLTHSMIGKFNIGNFFCDIVRAKIKADIVLQNVMGIRIDSFSKGDITPKMLYNADPFANEIILFEMTAALLREFIISNYSHFKKLDLCVSGIHYHISTNKQKAFVDIRLPDGSALMPNKIYKVAMNSYMAESYTLPNKIGKSTNLHITNVGATLEYLQSNPKVAWHEEKRATLR
ncbi:MAG: bifunctional metallophosphatase/5'-nucleotidase [Bacteroidales bacterium]